jgi:hypothetical protein
VSVFLLIWTVLSVLVETGLPALPDIKVVWKRFLCATILAPAHLLVLGKNLVLKRREWFARANEWLKS